MTNDTLTAVPGFRVGHVTDLDAITGCTAILCPPNTIGGVDVRGGAPGTRETDLLDALKSVEHVTAVLLSGGSAFGLATADGAMRWHAERDLGYKTRIGVTVPIIPTAILFDLGIGRSDVRPDAAMGYAACDAATADPVGEGSVGAGTGAIIAALMGPAYASKGGIGSAVIDLGGGLMVGAVVAINSVGEILNEDGTILAGLRDGQGGFVPFLDAMRAAFSAPAAPETETRENTVIGVVATNAKLVKTHVNKVAQMAHDGLARAVRPAHTQFDGDAIFALASGEIPADVNLVGAFAAEAVAQSIRRAVRAATSLGGVQAVSSLT